VFRADIPFVNDLGVEFFAADAARATIALQLHARHLNSWNVAHGGVIDVAMASVIGIRSSDRGATVHSDVLQPLRSRSRANSAAGTGAESP
jgi:acyl-coenzyme A thioesterase PaaI-like protein